MAKRRCGCKKAGGRKGRRRSMKGSGILKGKAGGIFKAVRKPVKFIATTLKQNSSDPEVRKAAAVMGKLASSKKRKQSAGAKEMLVEAIKQSGI